MANMTGRVRGDIARRNRWASVLAVLAAFVLLVMTPRTVVGQATQPSANKLAEADRLNGQVLRLLRDGRYDRGIPIAQRVVALREEVLGLQHADVAMALNNLAELYKYTGDYDQAEAMHLRALAIKEKALGAEHPSVATTLTNLGELYRTKKDYDKAEPLYLRGLSIREKVLGPEASDVANSCNNLALLYQAKGQYDKAESLYRRALAIWEKNLGPNHPDVGSALNNIALLYEEKGDYGKAEASFQRALAIWEGTIGLGHPATVTMLDNLAGMYAEMEDFAKGLPICQRVIDLKERKLGPDDPEVALSLNNLAGLYVAKGDHAKARSLYQRAQAIVEKALGPESPEVTISLNGLAGIYDREGEYAKAEPLYRRALTIVEKAYGPDDLGVARLLNNLALLYLTKGDFADAEPLYQRSLAIKEKALGPQHPGVATSLNNLAGFYYQQRNYAKAESLYLRALAIREKSLGPGDLSVADTLHNLAATYADEEDYAKAEPLYLRALATREKVLGPQHSLVGVSLSDLALLYLDQGDYAKAEPLSQRSLAIKTKALGLWHPSRAISFSNMASLYLARGDVSKATRALEETVAIEDHNVAIQLLAGSDEQKRAYIGTFRPTTWGVISLHVQFAPNDQKVRRLALTTILRRKGRVLDTMTDSMTALRHALTPADRKQLDELKSISSQYSALTWAGSGNTSVEAYRKTLDDLDKQRQALEDQISRKNTGFLKGIRDVGLKDVQAAIPEGAALVELFRYTPYRVKVSYKQRWGKARYVAYVLRREGDILYTDLGEAGPIDEATKNLLAELRRATGTPNPAAKALDALVMQPIRRLLGETRWVFLSPDGPLNLVPFGALVDDKGHYLVENYSFTYLTSGRDLLRFGSVTSARQSPVVVAAPYFDKASEPAAIQDQGQRSFDMEKLTFAPLVHAAEEGRHLGGKLPDTKVLLGVNATEGAVKALHGPRLLHIATHGFFLPDQPELNMDPNREIAAGSSGPGAIRYRPFIDNPLLRSGLAFAGANVRKSGNDDGVLTALEASQLDLYGTKLVVLSACETGVGDVLSGDGVYGLRRALVMAGSETQTMSLWKVDDAATRALMEAYYDKLLRGGGRSESLREVQLAMLKDPKRSHPYYWGSFIVSGNPAALDGSPIVPNVGQVSPGMRGCSCDVGMTSTSGSAAWLIVLAALGLLRAGRGKVITA